MGYVLMKFLFVAVLIQSWFLGVWAYKALKDAYIFGGSYWGIGGVFLFLFLVSVAVLLTWKGSHL